MCRIGISLSLSLFSHPFSLDSPFSSAPHNRASVAISFPLCCHLSVTLTSNLSLSLSLFLSLSLLLALSLSKTRPFSLFVKDMATTQSMLTAAQVATHT